MLGGGVKAVVNSFCFLGFKGLAQYLGGLVALVVGAGATVSEIFVVDVVVLVETVVEEVSLVGVATVVDVATTVEDTGGGGVDIEEELVPVDGVCCAGGIGSAGGTGGGVVGSSKLLALVLVICVKRPTRARQTAVVMKRAGTPRRMAVAMAEIVAIIMHTATVPNFCAPVNRLKSSYVWWREEKGLVYSNACII